HGMTVAGRYLQFSVVVPDSPGNLAALLTDCAETDANVLDVEHVRTSHEITVDQVEIALVLETKGPEHQEKVLQALRAKGYDVRGPASQPV
ncbi:MAG TPA: ACT domain-containing protein, partial [Phycicoccus sp.]|nr:ACT domain-containing protein [Phycicoccus sp.]